MSSLIINANALFIPLADKSVHTIVTSPPYYGLRDYGTAKWEGGDSECDHKQYLGGHNPEVSPKQLSSQGTQQYNYRNKCGKCGAVRIDEQIGLEVTPDAYIANLVNVFRECKRILRDDGTLWVNIGDSYVSNTGDRNKVGGFQANPSDSRLQAESAMSFNKKSGELKSKDLIGIPWMLAFALRADGWYLRQDIIWAKPNPMPESVKDRCTKSHEYIFLLSKSQKYYYDNEAVKEPANYPNDDRKARAKEDHKSMPDGLRNGLRPGNYDYDMTSRNKRDVWTVTTKPYKGAHYATFNPELIKPCILAGAPETCCAKCGAPYVRVVERKKGAQESTARPKGQGQGGYGVKGSTLGIGGGGHGNAWKEKGTKVITTGYQSTCDCNAGTSSGIVFDPFVGSGTTVATAIQLGRKGIGLDLSLKYLRENARERIYEQEMQPTISF